MNLSKFVTFSSITFDGDGKIYMPNVTFINLFFLTLMKRQCIQFD